MLFEPATTLNTGDAESELTKYDLEKFNPGLSLTRQALLPPIPASKKLCLLLHAIFIKRIKPFSISIPVISPSLKQQQPVLK